MTNNNAFDAANDPQNNGPYGQGSGSNDELAGPYGDGGKNQTLEKAKSEVTQTAITTILVALLSIFAHSRAGISDSEYMVTMFKLSSEVGDNFNIIILVGLALVAAVLAGLAGFMGSIGVAKRRLLAFSAAGVFGVLLAYGAYAYFAKDYMGDTFGSLKDLFGMSWGFGMFMFFGVVAVGIASAVMLGMRVAKVDTWADGQAPIAGSPYASNGAFDGSKGYNNGGYAQNNAAYSQNNGGYAQNDGDDKGFDGNTVASEETQGTDDDVEVGQPGYGPGYGEGQPAQQSYGAMEGNPNLGDQGYRHSADTGYIHGTGQNFDDPNQIEENPNR